MKKLAVFIISAFMILSFSSCSVPPSSIKAASEPTYSNEELKDLCTALVSDSLIPKEGKALEADYIGAAEGYRFSNSANYGNVEIYYFDKFDSEYYKTAKETGKLSLWGSEYNAVISKNGKIMMLFSSSVTVPEISSDTSSDSSESEAAADLYKSILNYNG